MNFFTGNHFGAERFGIGGCFQVIGDAAHAKLHDFLHRGQLGHAENPGGVIEVALGPIPSIQVRVNVHDGQRNVKGTDHRERDAVISAQNNRKGFLRENFFTAAVIFPPVSAGTVG